MEWCELRERSYSRGVIIAGNRLVHAWCNGLNSRIILLYYRPWLWLVTDFYLKILRKSNHFAAIRIQEIQEIRERSGKILVSRVTSRDNKKWLAKRKHATPYFFKMKPIKWMWLSRTSQSQLINFLQFIFIKFFDKFFSRRTKHSIWVCVSGIGFIPFNFVVWVITTVEPAIQIRNS